MFLGSLSSLVNHPDREASHSPQYSANANKDWIYLHFPIYLHGVQKDNINYILPTSVKKELHIFLSVQQFIIY